MAKFKFFGELTGKDTSVKVVLPLISFIEGDVTIIYSAALDLSGYGADEQAARRSFEVALEEFIKYTFNKGTYKKELKRLGWTVRKRKTEITFKPPFLDEQLRDNDYLSDILREKEFHRYNENVSLPVPA